MALGSKGMYIQPVVYFDQLSGAVCIQKLFETIFLAVSTFFCRFYMFFGEYL